jgi:NTE family protein
LRDHTQATIAVDVNAPAEPLHDEEAEEQEAAAGGLMPSMRKFFGVSESTESVADASRDPSVIDLFARSLDTVQETITRLKLAAQPPDLLITIPRNVCMFYDFHRAESVIEWGRKRTREALDRWTPPEKGARV